MKDANEIYDPTTDDCLTAVPHCAVIIGYGTNENSEDYWLIMNSHGPSWGFSGYGRITRSKICNQDVTIYSAEFEYTQSSPKPISAAISGPSDASTSKTSKKGDKANKSKTYRKQTNRTF